jgi:glutaredoxin
MSKKVQIYSSSATSSLKIKKDTQSLKFLLEKKHVAYDELDMAQMDKDARDKVYGAANTRNLPLLFVDDAFIGDYDEVQYKEECEVLDKDIK